jgi:hypothetical protein
VTVVSQECDERFIPQAEVAGPMIGEAEVLTDHFR